MVLRKQLAVISAIVVALAVQPAFAIDSSTSVQTIDVQLSKSNPLSGWVEISIRVDGALSVEVFTAQTNSTAAPVLLGTAVQDIDNPSRWHFPWNTELTGDGDYVLFAKVRNAFGTYSSSNQLPATIINNTTDDSEALNTTSLSSDATLSPPPSPSTLSAPLSSPTQSAIVTFSQSGVLFGAITITVDVDLASRVTLLLRQGNTDTPTLLGEASRDPNNTSRWIYIWDTLQTPNGLYNLLIKITNSYGSYTSAPVSISVYNLSEQSPYDDSKIIEEPTDDGAGELEIIKKLGGEEDGIMREMLTTEELPPPPLEIREQEPAPLSPEVIREEIKEEIREDIHRATETLRAFDERKEANISADSDGDGISDFDETRIFETNPYNNDTDRDGVSDAAELLAGRNPKSASAANAIIYENPRETGTEKPGLFSIKEITVTKIEERPDGTKTAREITFKGTAQPNSFITLFIFSTPIVVTVKTDADGEWSYTIDKELEGGTHEVFVTVTDGAGKILAKSSPFQFIKEATAVTLDQNAISRITQNEKPGFFEGNQLALVALLLAVVIGFALVLIGIGRSRNQL